VLDAAGRHDQAEVRQKWRFASFAVDGQEYTLSHHPDYTPLLRDAFAAARDRDA
jgi:hypothetical protein